MLDKYSEKWYNKNINATKTKIENMEHSLFKPKKLPIETGGVIIALLNKSDAKRLDLHAGDRIKISSNGKKTSAILDIAFGSCETLMKKTSIDRIKKKL